MLSFATERSNESTNARRPASESRTRVIEWAPEASIVQRKTCPCGGGCPHCAGRSLDDATRARMEVRFGESFAGVRLHTGPDAHAAADAAGARAFTVGQDIVFGAGEFALESSKGQQLLAHELAHVVQQRQSGPPSEERAAERDARHAARDAMNGRARVRARAVPGKAQKQAKGEEPIATTKPGVDTSTTLSGEAAGVTVRVEGQRIAIGTTSFDDHPKDDGGTWDPGARTLRIHVTLERFGTLSALDEARMVARDLGINLIVLIPVVDGAAQPEIVINPAPEKPATAPSASLPRPALDLASRQKKIESNLKRFTFNPFWDRDIIDSFQGLSLTDFLELQSRLGEDGMARVFDQLSAFSATRIGTFGPIIRGRARLTERRVDFILETKDWGPLKDSFYRWMFEWMLLEDIRLVLNQLAKKKRLRETVLTVPGLAAYLKNRGIADNELVEESANWYEGIGRGLEGVSNSAWAGTIFGNGPGTEATYLPQKYRDQYAQGLTTQFQQAMTPGNVVRGAASNLTFGLSEVPFGIFEAAHATGSAIADIQGGEYGQATQKLTPVALMILAALLGKKVGKLAAGAGLEEESALAATGGRGVARPRFDVRPIGRTAAGLERYLVRSETGELVEMLVDRDNKTIQATNLATGDRIIYENGQIRQAPAGLLPAAAESLPGINTGPNLLPPAGRPLLLPPGQTLSGLPVQPGAAVGGGLTIDLTESQAEKLALAENAPRWTDLPGGVRTSLGKRYGYIVEELTRTLSSGGRAKAVLHYPLVDRSLIQSLEPGGGRVVITQGRLKGGDLRFDIAEIDFDHRTVEVIDLTPTSDAAHLSKTAEYQAELRRLTGFEVTAVDLRYVGDDARLLDELQSVSPGSRTGR